MQIAIVLYPGFTALDFIGPYETLHYLPDAEVRFLWHEPGPITADSGVLTVGATHSFEETPSPDIILVPGGTTTFEHARDEAVLAWLRKADTTSTWTTSVCSGSVLLAAAGLPEGHKATSHSDCGADAQNLRGDRRQRRTRGAPGQIRHRSRVSAGLDLGLWLAGQIAGERRPRPSTGVSSTTRSRRSTPATFPRPRCPPRPPPPPCSPREC